MARGGRRTVSCTHRREKKKTQKAHGIVSHPLVALLPSTYFSCFCFLFFFSPCPPVSRIVGSITSRGETTHNKTQKSIIFLFHILRFSPIKKKNQSNLSALCVSIYSRRKSVVIHTNSLTDSFLFLPPCRGSSSSSTHR